MIVIQNLYKESYMNIYEELGKVNICMYKKTRQRKCYFQKKTTNIILYINKTINKQIYILCAIIHTFLFKLSLYRAYSKAKSLVGKIHKLTKLFSVYCPNWQGPFL